MFFKMLVSSKTKKEAYESPEWEHVEIIMEENILSIESGKEDDYDDIEGN